MNDAAPGTGQGALGGRRLLGHPVWLTLGIGVLVGLVNLAWLSSVRPAGPWNPDEGHYLTHALAIGDDLAHGDPSGALARLDSQTSPTVPATSAVFVAIGGRSTTAAMLGVVSLVVATAVAVAGLTSRLAGARAAAVAGVVALCAPFSIVAARSYSFAPAVSAGMLGALWALVASDRGKIRSRMVLFGVAVGVMLLSRTMTVSFLPAIAVAVLLLVERTRAAAENVALGAGAALVVAGPWWLSQWGPTVGYLTGYGFGAESASYGASGLPDRVLNQVVDLAGAVHNLLPLVVVVVGCTVALLLRSVRRGTHLGALVAAHRELVAVTAACATGFLTLLTSRNAGWMFTTPLYFAATAVIVSAASLIPGRTPAVLGSIAVCLAPLVVGLSLTDPGGSAATGPTGVARMIVYGVSNDIGTGVDPAYDSGSLREIRKVNRAWRSANTEVVRATVDHGGNDVPVQTVIGSCPFINSATIELESALRLGDAAPTITGARTSEGEAALRRGLSAEVGDRRRVLVAVRSDCQHYPGDEDSEDVLGLARELGWETVEVIDLPDGGTVDVLRRVSA